MPFVENRLARGCELPLWTKLTHRIESETTLSGIQLDARNIESFVIHDTRKMLSDANFARSSSVVNTGTINSA